MGLIDRDTPPSAYEPSVNNTSYGRDQIRNLVRACILRDRTLPETLGQVQRDFSFAGDVKSLAGHFYAFETGVPAVDIGAN
tara:strand:+ start:10792 stop:11034 length:243 start_codon:yes stop_codon:yes gene_type:complete